MPKLATLIKETKKYALNPTSSNEEFLNAFLNPYITAGKIKNRFGEELYFDKTRTSVLMNHKEDVPQKLRQKLGQCGIKEETIEGMSVFIEDYINPTMHSQLAGALLETIRTDQAISESDKRSLSKQQNNLAALLTELLLRSFSESNLCVQGRNIIWKNSSNAVEVITGDIFHFGFESRRRNEKNIVVIPVNTAFDTHVNRKLEGNPAPGVSKKTLHGEWLKRMEQSEEKVPDLDKRIAASLSSLGYKPVQKESSANKKRDIYDIGSIAVIETKNAIYFLLALSEFDESNRAQSTPDNVVTATESLLRFYDRVGQGYDLYMPIIGSGRSRTGLAFKEAYHLLIDVMLKNKDLIQGRIYLVVRPDNIDEIKEDENGLSN